MPSTESPQAVVPRSPTPRQQQTLKQACLAARILDDYRGQDTLVLDLTNITPIADYFVITTGSSPRQMQSIAEEIRVVLKQQGSRPIGTEGDGSNAWILQDYGDIVVHILTIDARKLYDLEHLWGDAPRVDWQSIVPPTTPRT